jgi:hypothetical protein
MFRLPRRRRRAGRPAGSSAPDPGSGLEVCAACHADHVHPVEWEESGDEHWWMLLRCGACRADREVTVTNEAAERYGRDLDAAQAVMARAARELDLERMSAEVEALAAALERDLIDADDFARPIGR